MLIHDNILTANQQYWIYGISIAVCILTTISYFFPMFLKKKEDRPEGLNGLLTWFLFFTVLPGFSTVFAVILSVAFVRSKMR